MILLSGGLTNKVLTDRAEDLFSRIDSSATSASAISPNLLILWGRFGAIGWCRAYQNTVLPCSGKSGKASATGSISSEEISLLILSGNFLTIALVDQYKLSHSWLEDVCALDFCNDTPYYTGQNIVICGYDADADEFEIRDPASSR